VILYIPGVDSLVASEWLRLQEVASLLEPFAVQTNLLQSDAHSLSSILPSILDLECHLEQHTAAATVKRSMLRDMHDRFQTILQPDTHQFNPLPAAACLLDPTLASVLLGPNQASLLHAAKMFIVHLTLSIPPTTTNAVRSNTNSTATTSGLQRFKFLAAKMTSDMAATATTPAAPASGNGTHTQESAISQINRYLVEIADQDIPNALEFWRDRRATYSSIALIAEDLISAPASQAFVERIFSLCGILTAGRRNRMKRSLEMRAFLKLNCRFLQ